MVYLKNWSVNRKYDYHNSIIFCFLTTFSFVKFAINRTAKISTVVLELDLLSDKQAHGLEKEVVTEYIYIYI